MKDKILAALRASKADYTEIRLEEQESARVVYRGQDLETASAVIDRGGIVRCLVKDVSIAGNVYQDLQQIAALSQETDWVQSGIRAPYVLLPKLNVITKEG